MMVRYAHFVNNTEIQRNICFSNAQKQPVHDDHNWISDVYDGIEMIYRLPICAISDQENVLTRIRFARPLPRAVFKYDNSQIRTFFTDGSATVSDFESDREASWAKRPNSRSHDDALLQ